MIPMNHKKIFIVFYWISMITTEKKINFLFSMVNGECANFFVGNSFSTLYYNEKN